MKKITIDGEAVLVWEDKGCFPDRDVCMGWKDRWYQGTGKKPSEEILTKVKGIKRAGSNRRRKKIRVSKRSLNNLEPGNRKGKKF